MKKGVAGAIIGRATRSVLRCPWSSPLSPVNRFRLNFLTSGFFRFLVASGSEFQTLVPPVVSQLCVPAGVNFTRKGLLVSDAAAGGCRELRAVLSASSSEV